MRSNYEIEIVREDGTVQEVPMYCTTYQANKALTALSYALNQSGVDHLTLWVVTKLGRVQHSKIGYGKINKAGKAA